MKVLVVDGPARGQIRDVKSLEFVAVDSSFANLGNIQETTYHVHRFYVAGQMINLASTSLLIDSIKDRDVFEQIVSDKAKEAVV